MPVDKRKQAELLRASTKHYTMTDTTNILPSRHQNWRISPELRNRDIYLRYCLQTLFLERIGLDKGVHISISSISDRQTSSLVSRSTSFCASSSAPKKTFNLAMTDPVLFLLPGCARPGFITLIPKSD